MVKKYSIVEARNKFASIVHEAQEGIRVELTRRGKTVAVLIGIENFERMSTPNPDFWRAYQEFRRNHDLASLEIDPDEVWGDVRDPSPGRDFEW